MAIKQHQRQPTCFLVLTQGQNKILRNNIESKSVFVVNANKYFRILYIHLSSVTTCFGRFWPPSGSFYNKIYVNVFLIKSTDALISQIYFCQENLLVSGSSSAHHQEFVAEEIVNKTNHKQCSAFC